MRNSRKIQTLLIEYLLKNGEIELLLPDGVSLQIGVTKTNNKGKLEISNDYCYVVSSREGKSTMLDSYNLGLQFLDQDGLIIYEDNKMGEDGENIRTLDVI